MKEIIPALDSYIIGTGRSVVNHVLCETNERDCILVLNTPPDFHFEGKEQVRCFTSDNWAVETCRVVKKDGTLWHCLQFLKPVLVGDVPPYMSWQERQFRSDEELKKLALKRQIKMSGYSVTLADNWVELLHEKVNGKCCRTLWLTSSAKVGQAIVEKRYFKEVWAGDGPSHNFIFKKEVLKEISEQIPFPEACPLPKERHKQRNYRN